MRKLKNEELHRLSVNEFREAEKIPFVLVLDNVRSLNNVGSAFRTADAFILEKIYLCGITGKPPHREINKTALGATESVVWEYYSDILEVVKKLRIEGYKIIAVEQADNSRILNTYTPKGEKWAFIFGNEVSGVSDEIIEIVDAVVEIPQFGTKHSINISVSIGIIVWDFLCKLNILRD